MDETEIDRHALKHGLTAEEVKYAWENPIACRARKGEDDPPIYIAIGVLPDGRMAELVGLETDRGTWLVFHAMVPPTKKFLKELGMSRR